MNTWAFIPLISFLTFAGLIVIVLQQEKGLINKLFTHFLIASGVWSFTSFMLVYNPSAPLSYYLFWNGMVLTAIPWVVVAYLHFVLAYTKKSINILLILGYSFVVFLFVQALSGNLVKDAYIVNGFMFHEIKPWDYVIAAMVFPMLVIVMVALIKRYQASTDYDERNRIRYLVTGWSILVVISYIVPFTPQLAGLPIDHIGNLINAMIITYTIRKYKLLDIRLVIRKGLVYSSLTIFLTTFYLVALFIVQMGVHDVYEYTNLLMAGVVALITALVFNPFRNGIQRWIDKLFYRETYDYRQILLRFSDRINNVIDLGELAKTMLDPIIEVMHVKQAALLFSDSDSNEFIPQFVNPEGAGGQLTQMRLLNDNPLVTWMAEKGEIIQRKFIGVHPQLKGLWEAEKEALEVEEVELLCPIRSKGNLIGILVLGEKQSGSPYTEDEIDLLTTMANEAAIAMENARMLNSIKVHQNQVEQLLAQVVMAQEEERKRISADLHDSVAQWLAAASYRVQTANALLPIDSSAAGDELNTMENTIDKSLKELRRIVVGLRPPALDELGLEHAIRQILDELRQDGIVYRFTKSGEPVRLSSSLEIAIYRTVQEAITNIRKHAEAKMVTVTMQYRSEMVTIRISDDGKGFDFSQTLRSAVAVGHMGILGMKQRAETLGGEMTIETHENSGTTITLNFPIQTPLEVTK